MGRKTGYKHSQETIEKLKAIARVKPHSFLFKNGNIPHNKGKKGSVAWNKGLTKDDPRVAKYTNKLIGRKLSEEHRKKCANGRKGIKPAITGKHHTIESRIKMSNSHNGVKLSENHRGKQRIGHIEYIKRKCGGVMPMVGKYEKEILDKLQVIFGYEIKRNFYIDGYYLDGFIQEMNLAIEIDEDGHFDLYGNLKHRDIERQNRIERLLNCKFLRIKESKYLKFKN